MQGGSGKLKTKSQGQKGWVQSRNMPTKAVRTLKKRLETGQRRAGEKEIKQQLRGESVTIRECIGEMALAVLGEDWKKTHAKRALVANPERPDYYHDEKAGEHEAAAQFHVFAANAPSKNPKLAAKHNITSADRNNHMTKGLRHYKIAKAHRAMARKSRAKNLPGYVDMEPDKN